MKRNSVGKGLAGIADADNGPPSISYQLGDCIVSLALDFFVFKNFAVTTGFLVRCGRYNHLLKVFLYSAVKIGRSFCMYT